MAYACSLFDQSVNRIYFDNCGIKDEDFAAILSGVSNHDDFKSIVYTRNGFDQKSLMAMKPLFKKKIPYHLSELRIADCKMSSKIYASLVSTIYQGCQLVKLALVQAKLSDHCFVDLTNFVKTSSTLTELDLSWCDASMLAWAKFVETLKTNKKLVTLNLQFNSIFDSKNGKTE